MIFRYGSNNIRYYNEDGTFGVITRLWSFDDGDGYAIGDVVGNSKKEFIVIDESADRLTFTDNNWEKRIID